MAYYVLPTKQVNPWFADAHPRFNMLNSRVPLNQTGQEGDAVRLMNATGTLGDIVFMKPQTIHSSCDRRRSAGLIRSSTRPVTPLYPVITTA